MANVLYENDHDSDSYNPWVGSFIYDLDTHELHMGWWEAHPDVVEYLEDNFSWEMHDQLVYGQIKYDDRAEYDPQRPWLIRLYSDAYGHPPELDNEQLEQLRAKINMWIDAYPFDREKPKYQSQGVHTSSVEPTYEWLSHDGFKTRINDYYDQPDQNMSPTGVKYLFNHNTNHAYVWPVNNYGAPHHADKFEQLGEQGLLDPGSLENSTGYWFPESHGASAAWDTLDNRIPGEESHYGLRAVLEKEGLQFNEKGGINPATIPFIDRESKVAAVPITHKFFTQDYSTSYPRWQNDRRAVIYDPNQHTFLIGNTPGAHHAELYDAAEDADHPIDSYHEQYYHGYIVDKPGTDRAVGFHWIYEKPDGSYGDQVNDYAARMLSPSGQVYRANELIHEAVPEPQEQNEQLNLFTSWFLNPKKPGQIKLELVPIDKPNWLDFIAEEGPPFIYSPKQNTVFLADQRGYHYNLYEDLDLDHTGTYTGRYIIKDHYVQWYERPPDSTIIKEIEQSIQNVSSMFKTAEQLSLDQPVEYRYQTLHVTPDYQIPWSIKRIPFIFDQNDKIFYISDDPGGHHSPLAEAADLEYYGGGNINGYIIPKGQEDPGIAWAQHPGIYFFIDHDLSTADMEAAKKLYPEVPDVYLPRGTKIGSLGHPKEIHVIDTTSDAHGYGLPVLYEPMTDEIYMGTRDASHYHFQEQLEDLLPEYDQWASEHNARRLRYYPMLPWTEQTDFYGLDNRTKQDLTKALEDAYDQYYLDGGPDAHTSGMYTNRWLMSKGKIFFNEGEDQTHWQMLARQIPNVEEAEDYYTASDYGGYWYEEDGYPEEVRVDWAEDDAKLEQVKNQVLKAIQDSRQQRLFASAKSAVIIQTDDDSHRMGVPFVIPYSYSNANLPIIIATSSAYHWQLIEAAVDQIPGLNDIDYSNGAAQRGRIFTDTFDSADVYKDFWDRYNPEDQELIVNTIREHQNEFSEETRDTPENRHYRGVSSKVASEAPTHTIIQTTDQSHKTYGYPILYDKTFNHMYLGTTQSSHYGLIEDGNDQGIEFPNNSIYEYLRWYPKNPDNDQMWMKRYNDYLRLMPYIRQALPVDKLSKFSAKDITTHRWAMDQDGHVVLAPYKGEDHPPYHYQLSEQLEDEFGQGAFTTGYIHDGKVIDIFGEELPAVVADKVLAQLGQDKIAVQSLTVEWVHINDPHSIFEDAAIHPIIYSPKMNTAFVGSINCFHHMVYEALEDAGIKIQFPVFEGRVYLVDNPVYIEWYDRNPPKEVSRVIEEIVQEHTQKPSLLYQSHTNTSPYLALYQGFRWLYDIQKRLLVVRPVSWGEHYNLAEDNDMGLDYGGGIDQNGYIATWYHPYDVTNKDLVLPNGLEQAIRTLAEYGGGTTTVDTSSSLFPRENRNESSLDTQQVYHSALDTSDKQEGGTTTLPPLFEHKAGELALQIRATIQDADILSFVYSAGKLAFSDHQAHYELLEELGNPEQSCGGFYYPREDILEWHSGWEGSTNDRKQIRKLILQKLISPVPESRKVFGNFDILPVSALSRFDHLRPTNYSGTYDWDYDQEGLASYMDEMSWKFVWDFIAHKIFVWSDGETGAGDGTYSHYEGMEDIEDELGKSYDPNEMTGGFIDVKMVEGQPYYTVILFKGSRPDLGPQLLQELELSPQEATVEAQGNFIYEGKLSYTEDSYPAKLIPTSNPQVVFEYFGPLADVADIKWVYFPSSKMIYFAFLWFRKEDGYENRQSIHHFMVLEEATEQGGSWNNIDVNDFADPGIGGTYYYPKSNQISWEGTEQENEEALTLANQVFPALIEEAINLAKEQGEQTVERPKAKIATKLPEVITIDMSTVPKEFSVRRKSYPFIYSYVANTIWIGNTPGYHSDLCEAGGDQGYSIPFQQEHGTLRPDGIIWPDVDIEVRQALKNDGWNVEMPLGHTSAISVIEVRGGGFHSNSDEPFIFTRADNKFYVLSDRMGYHYELQEDMPNDTDYSRGSIEGEYLPKGQAREIINKDPFVIIYAYPDLIAPELLSTIQQRWPGVPVKGLDPNGDKIKIATRIVEDPRDYSTFFDYVNPELMSFLYDPDNDTIYIGTGGNHHADILEWLEDNGMEDQDHLIEGLFHDSYDGGYVSALNADQNERAKVEKALSAWDQQRRTSDLHWNIIRVDTSEFKNYNFPSNRIPLIIDPTTHNIYMGNKNSHHSETIDAAEDAGYVIDEYSAQAVYRFSNPSYTTYFSFGNEPIPTDELTKLVNPFVKTASEDISDDYNPNCPECGTQLYPRYKEDSGFVGACSNCKVDYSLPLAKDRQASTDWKLDFVANAEAGDTIRGKYGYPVIIDKENHIAYIGPLGAHHANVAEELIDQGLGDEDYEVWDWPQINIWPPGESVDANPDRWNAKWYLPKYEAEDPQLTHMLEAWATEMSKTSVINRLASNTKVSSESDDQVIDVSSMYEGPITKDEYKFLYLEDNDQISLWNVDDYEGPHHYNVIENYLGLNDAEATGGVYPSDGINPTFFCYPPELESLLKPRVFRLIAQAKQRNASILSEIGETING